MVISSLTLTDAPLEPAVIEPRLKEFLGIHDGNELVIKIYAVLERHYAELG
jgi:hypothetical protein